MLMRIVTCTVVCMVVIAVGPKVLSHGTEPSPAAMVSLGDWPFPLIQFIPQHSIAMTVQRKKQLRRGLSTDFKRLSPSKFLILERTRERQGRLVALTVGLIFAALAPLYRLPTIKEETRMLTPISQFYNGSC